MGVDGGIVLTRAVCIILTVEGLEEARSFLISNLELEP